jgi:hypothetical protein
MKRLVKALQDGDRFLLVWGFMPGFCVAFVGTPVWAHALIAAAVVRAEARVKGRGALADDAEGALEAGRREPMMAAGRA